MLAGAGAGGYKPEPQNFSKPFEFNGLAGGLFSGGEGLIHIPRTLDFVAVQVH